MVDIYHRAKDETDYTATRFIQMVGERGGVETAKILIGADHESEGCAALFERGRLDLTVEAVVVDNPEYHPLFLPSELSKARSRLTKYGYAFGQPRGRGPGT
jgi:hypothetical protein